MKQQNGRLADQQLSEQLKVWQVAKTHRVRQSVVLKVVSFFAV